MARYFLGSDLGILKQSIRIYWLEVDLTQTWFVCSEVPWEGMWLTVRNRFGAGIVKILQLFMGYMDRAYLKRKKLRKKNEEFRVLKYCICCGFGCIYKFRQTNKKGICIQSYKRKEIQGYFSELKKLFLFPQIGIGCH